MKLHIECLQEKLDGATADQASFTKQTEELRKVKDELKQFVGLSQKIESDLISAQRELAVC